MSAPVRLGEYELLFYGRMYMQHGMGYQMRDRGWTVGHGLFMHVVADGQDLGEHIVQQQYHWTTVQFSLTRGDDDVEWDKTLKWFLQDIAPKLSPGQHQVQIVFAAEGVGPQGPTGQEKVQLATGTFALTVPADRDARLAAALEKENKRVAAHEAQDAAEVARMRAQGLVDVSVTFVGGCGVKFIDPADASEVGSDAGWYKPGVRVEACDSTNDVCHTIGFVSNEPEQEFEAKCD